LKPIPPSSGTSLELAEVVVVEDMVVDTEEAMDNGQVLTGDQT
jgi:hypothetical protein